jgi:hypothetical protein
MTKIDKYLKKVQKNGHMLQDVPMKYRTEEVCQAAIEQDGGALDFVPAALQAAVERRLKEAAE